MHKTSTLKEFCLKKHLQESYMKGMEFPLIWSLFQDRPGLFVLLLISVILDYLGVADSNSNLGQGCA